MKQAVELNIRGIKCDNPNCDYRNDKVEFKDYEKWLNKPCPKCGANLLTKEDLEMTKALINVANIANKVLPKQNNEEERIKAIIEMNGTGRADFKLKED
ncbi:hypothetical protein [Clostridium sporogenes]|uniref:hypothetical protein n=1 Tax=Clostridium sporogenes TaxID=1509 RepID=UPI00024BA2D4|nr:hypothetical protein [Clostridium sporogenes]EHN17090.1 hypothetical protein IYC_00295 [Clostridium sporogenes PA 3679]NFQ36292.1 hypothetical protein [Clostridium sporogenes]NFQ61961.1 hypothetical protein [Clostridium sporogenes]NFU11635.1 hypothetical protein [Clostridium sporogenes]NFU45465.1 hypothetical protein [Clostridium sporogenes]